MARDQCRALHQNMKVDTSNMLASVYKHSNQTNNAIEEGGDIVVNEDLDQMPQLVTQFVMVHLFNKLNDVGFFF